MPNSPEIEDIKTLRLAAMDFAMFPMEQIKAELKCGSNAVNDRRRTQLYKDTLSEIKKEWKEKLLKTSGTNDLKKKISYGMAIAIHRLVGILAAHDTANKDIVSAARLMAQMDGRFIGSEGDKVNADHDTESVAQELIQAIKRTKETVQ